MQYLKAVIYNRISEKKLQLKQIALETYLEFYERLCMTMQIFRSSDSKVAATTYKCNRPNDNQLKWTIS